jgi:hypothetical protein
MSKVCGKLSFSPMKFKLQPLEKEDGHYEVCWQRTCNFLSSSLMVAKDATGSGNVISSV